MNNNHADNFYYNRPAVQQQPEVDFKVTLPLMTIEEDVKGNVAPAFAFLGLVGFGFLLYHALK